MLKFGNKEFRNLQEQVEKNMDDIKALLQGEVVLAEFGIKVLGQFETEEELYEAYPEDSEQFAELEFGAAFLVGTDTTEMYIKTRTDVEGIEGEWLNIGEFPKAGPQGEQGEIGPQGPQGIQGIQGIQGPQGPQGAGFQTIKCTEAADTPYGVQWLKTPSIVVRGTLNASAFTYGTIYCVPKGEQTTYGVYDEYYTVKAWSEGAGEYVYSWEKIANGGGSSAPVTSVNTKTGEVVLDATDIKLTTTGTTVQANFIRIDSEVEQNIDDITALETAVASKQNTLTAGTNITIVNDVISATGGGSEYTAGDGIDITDDVISVDNTIALKSEIPIATSDLTNDSGYITSSALTDYATTSYVDAEVADLEQAISEKADETDLTAHTGNTTIHVTASDKIAWSNKVNQSQLEDYTPTANLASVALSGSYNDLSNTPTIPSGALADLDSIDYTSNYITNKPTIPTVPTNVSAFTNDAGYLTQHQSLAGYATETYVNNAIGAIVIPTKTSDLTNDSGFITSSDIPACDVNSVNGQTGTVVLDASDINTEDDITIDEAIGGIKTDITALDTGKQDLITSSNKLSYSLLSDTPTIPTATSDLTNNSGFITSSYHDATKLDASKATVQTTAPTADITDGGIHIVKLTAAPAAYYNGYIYFIAE